MGSGTGWMACGRAYRERIRHS